MSDFSANEPVERGSVSKRSAPTYRGGSSSDSPLPTQGKLAIVSPQWRIGCAALLPEYPFTLEHHPEEQWRVMSDKWRANTTAPRRTVTRKIDRKETDDPATRGDTPREYSIFIAPVSRSYWSAELCSPMSAMRIRQPTDRYRKQAADLKGGGLRYQVGDEQKQRLRGASDK